MKYLHSLRKDKSSRHPEQDPRASQAADVSVANVTCEKATYIYSILSFCKWCGIDRWIITCSKYNYSHTSQISHLSFLIRILFSDVFRYKLYDQNYDKLENRVILYRFKDDAPVLLQASNDDDGAMTVAIIELQISRWSAGCAASHTKSACFRSMAVDNNRDGLLAIEIRCQDDSNEPSSQHSRGAKT